MPRITPRRPTTSVPTVRRSSLAAVCVMSALALGFGSGCGGGAGSTSGGLTSEEQVALDSASGYYLSQIDKKGKNAAGTAYGACQQAASDYPIVHRLLFARAFAKREQFRNGNGTHKTDLRSTCL